MRNQHKSSSPYPEWNNKKFEAKLEKEIEQRKNLISISANYILPNQENGSSYKIADPNGGLLVESTGIYKQFLLIGVPPSVENSRDPNVKPSVLIAYPPFEYPNMPIKKIIEHSMPTGQSREFLSTNPLSPIQDEFVFQFGGGLGAEGKPIYGVCVHVSTKDTSLPFYGCKADKDRIFCFCLMTKMPVFSVHFAFLTSLVLWTIGHVRHLHKYENKIRVNIPPGGPIDDLDLEDQIGHHPSVEVPVSFQNEIASYFISQISSEPEKLSRASSTFMQGYVTRKLEKMNNKRHNFRYDEEDCSIELRFPPAEDISENCIKWTALDTLFSLLSVQDILTIISGLLLDRQVLIIGSRLEEVSMTVWALQSILKPFKFAGTVIPILPTTSEDYIGLLQLPTPFLFGVPRCNELKVIKFLETAVFVDLDKKNVPPIEDLPNYPNENFVRTKLTKFLNSIKNKKELNEYGLPLIYKKTLNHKYSFSPSTCQKINEIINSPFQNSIYTNYICGFFVSAEGVTVFNEELFLGQIYSLITTQPEELYGETTPFPAREKEKEKKVNEEMDFWNNIVESQTFQMYIEERMLTFMDMKKRAISIDNLQENKDESDDDKINEDDIQKKAEETKDNKDNSSDLDNIKDIDKPKSTKVPKKEPLRKRKTLYNFDQISPINSPNRDGPLSNPSKISVNRNRKAQLKNPQRIKSLKNVLDDLPTPSSSNNKLIDLNDDRVKSDPDIEIDVEDHLNKNIRLANQKVSKSSNMAIAKSNLLLEEEEENNEIKQIHKSSKKNKKADDENENDKVNNKSQKNKQNQKKQQRKSSNTSDHENSENENDQETNKKHKNENKPTTTTKSVKQTKKNSNKKDDQNSSEDEQETTKKQRKSNESKHTSKSQRPTRVPLIKSDDNQISSDDEIVEPKTTKKTRKSNESNQTKSQKIARKSSNNDDQLNNNKSDSESEPETTKKQRKSNETKKSSKSQKITRAPVKKNIEFDDDESASANSEDNIEKETIKRRRKSNEVRRTSKSQKPTRVPLNKFDDDENSSDDEIIEQERSKRHRKSADTKLTTRSQKIKRKSSNNDDEDDNDENEVERNKRHRRLSNPPNQQKSQKPTRKSSNDNDEDDDTKERNIKNRKSSSNDKMKQSKKSSNENDEDDDTKERNIKNRKSSSNDKMKQTRKSSNDNDEDEDTKERNLKNRKSTSNDKMKQSTKKSSNENDEDEDYIKERSLKQRKSVSNDRLKLTKKHSNNDDYDEPKNQKQRRRSVQQSKSSANFNEKTHRKSNEDENNKNKTKSSKNQQIIRKATNPVLKNMASGRQRQMTNKDGKKIENDPNKKKIQMQFNSSSEYDTYSSESIDDELFYKDEHWDESSDKSESYEN